MEITGKIKQIKQVETFSSGFSKRELIIQTDEQYPQIHKIEFHNNNTNLLNSHREGDSIRVQIDIRGKEYVTPDGEVKHITTIVGWRVNQPQNNINN